MRIAVCDDLQEERARLIPMLRAYCEKNALSADYDEYDGGEALLQAFAPGAFALIFLDIYMNGITGVETARRLKAIDPGCVLVFTTTSLAHGADAFDVEAFHYLVKPIEQDKLFAVLNKWYDHLCEIKTVELKCGKTARTLFLRDILYIDVQGHCASVHTAAETIQTATPLSALAALLPAGEFCRPIRYCLASFRHMLAVTEAGAVLDNGETLAVARNEKENLRRELARYRLRMLRRR